VENACEARCAGLGEGILSFDHLEDLHFVYFHLSYFHLRKRIFINNRFMFIYFIFTFEYSIHFI
jgi:hypothetical protein